MKKYIKFLICFVAILFISVSHIRLNAQPDPPILPGEHGRNGDQTTHGVPLDGGTGILLSLAFVYMAVKVSVIKGRTIAGRKTF